MRHARDLDIDNTKAWKRSLKQDMVVKRNYETKNTLGLLANWARVLGPNCEYALYGMSRIALHRALYLRIAQLRDPQSRRLQGPTQS